MRLFELKDNQLVIVYPGRFHPFHKGHKSVYDYFIEKFPSAHTYIGTTNKQGVDSPFSFEEKKKMMQLAGIPDDKIKQVVRTYDATEITEKYDANNTVVLYGVSQKDVDRFKFPETGKATKKDGDPSYIQKWIDLKNAEPQSNHSYVTVVPTIDFKLMDNIEVSSASEIRNMFKVADEKKRKEMIMSLYNKENFEEVKEVYDIFMEKLINE